MGIVLIINYSKGGVKNGMIGKLKQMENQAKYGKRFAKQCDSIDDYLFYEQLETILHETITKIQTLQKITKLNENEN